MLRITGVPEFPALHVTRARFSLAMGAGPSLWVEIDEDLAADAVSLALGSTVTIESALAGDLQTLSATFVKFQMQGLPRARASVGAPSALLLRPLSAEAAATAVDPAPLASDTSPRLIVWQPQPGDGDAVGTAFQSLLLRCFDQQRKLIEDDAVLARSFGSTEDVIVAPAGWSRIRLLDQLGRVLHRSSHNVPGWFVTGANGDATRTSLRLVGAPLQPISLDEWPLECLPDLFSFGGKTATLYKTLAISDRPLKLFHVLSTCESQASFATEMGLETSVAVARPTIAKLKGAHYAVTALNFTFDGGTRVHHHVEIGSAETYYGERCGSEPEQIVVPAEVVGWDENGKAPGTCLLVKPPKQDAAWEIAAPSGQERRPIRATLLTPSSSLYGTPKAGEDVLMMLQTGRRPIVLGVAQHKRSELEALAIALTGKNVALWAGDRGSEIVGAAKNVALVDAEAGVRISSSKETKIMDVVSVTADKTLIDNELHAQKDVHTGSA